MKKTNKTKEKNYSKSTQKKTLQKKDNKKIKKQEKMQEKLLIKQEKRNAKKYKRKNPVLKVILIMLFILFILLTIFFGIRMTQNGWSLKGLTATLLGHDSSTLENLSELQFLVIGQSQGLTDTIMVCSYNPKSQTASILSIPRDTYTGKNKKTATAYQKINALYQQSPEKLIEKVNEITGLNIHYYIHIDTEGLIDLVDAIGGVYFDVPINMKYDDASQKLHINLKSGYQLLDGKKSEHLVRFRHNNNGTTYPSEYGQEDIGRMRTQREFIKAMIKQMLTPSSITKVDDYIKIANTYTKTNMNFSSLKDYIPYALEFNLENIRAESLPGVPEKCNQVWLYIHNKTKTLELTREIFNTDETIVVESGESESKNTDTNSKQSNSTQKTGTTEESAVSPSKIKIEILNGTNKKENLTKLKSDLQKLGYKVTKTGTTSTTSKTTIINRTKQNNPTQEELKKAIGNGSVSSGNSTNVDFTIVIGNDY